MKIRVGIAQNRVSVRVQNLGRTGVNIGLRILPRGICRKQLRREQIPDGFQSLRARFPEPA